MTAIASIFELKLASQSFVNSSRQVTAARQWFVHIVQGGRWLKICHEFIFLCAEASWVIQLFDRITSSRCIAFGLACA